MEIAEEDLVYELAQRTIHNLTFMNAKAKGQNELNPSVYEVTQLINSLLGLIVLPKELWKGQSTKKLVKFISEGLPQPEFIVPKASNYTLREFIRLLRHSIAHANIKFEHVDDATRARINKIVFWNHEDGNKKRPIDFKIKFTVSQVESFATKFSQIMLKAKRPHPKTEVVESIEKSRNK